MKTRWRRDVDEGDVDEGDVDEGDEDEGDEDEEGLDSFLYETLWNEKKKQLAGKTTLSIIACHKAMEKLEKYLERKPICKIWAAGHVNSMQYRARSSYDKLSTKTYLVGITSYAEGGRLFNKC